MRSGSLFGKPIPPETVHNAARMTELHSEFVNDSTSPLTIVFISSIHDELLLVQRSFEVP